MDETAVIATTDPFAGLPSIFRDCVSPDYRGMNGKMRLDSPWIDGPHVYASDGRIMVRRPLEGSGAVPAQIPEGRRPETAPGLFERAVPYDPVGVAVPDGPTGMVDCPECGGAGLLDWDFDDWGNRIESPGAWHWCHQCDGDKVLKNLEPVPVGRGIRLAAYYADILRRHWATLLLPIDGRDKVIPVHFRVDGYPEVEGVVMPLFPPDPGDPS
jgi:hypothetical protein